MSERKLKLSRYIPFIVFFCVMVILFLVTNLVAGDGTGPNTGLEEVTFMFNLL